jgi:hypothetical protein
VRNRDPRWWLGLSVATLLASVVPYWYWIGPAGIVLCGILALTAAGLLWINYRGERRLTIAAIEAAEADEAEDDEGQRLTNNGAPASTSASGTSTEPSSRW